MSTFLQICKDVRAQSGISGEGPSSVIGQVGIMADVVRWVEESYAEIQTIHENWNFLHNRYAFILQAGLSSHNPAELIADNGAIGVRTPTKDTFTVKLELSNEKIKRLKYLPWSVWQVDNRVIDGKVGQPELYTEAPDGTYHFYPFEEGQVNVISNIDHEISFNGFSRPHVMVDNDDLSILPEQYKEIIKIGALLRYAEYYNSPEVYKSAFASYAMQLKRLEYSELPRDNLRTPPLVSFA